MTMLSSSFVTPSSAKDCSPGNFLKASICYSCRQGCYCSGSSNSVGSHNVNKACDEHWSSSNGAWTDLHNGGVWLCPDDFPYSDSGKSTKGSCYTYTENDDVHQKVFYGTSWPIVNPGFYAPGGVFPTGDNIKSCPEGYVCYGSNSFTYSKNDQGLSTCPSGQKPNSEKTACEEVKNTITCATGAYLPAGAETCEACLSGYVCLGSTKLQSEGWYKTDGVDQGLLLPKDACTSTHGFDNEHYVANAYGNGCDKCPIGTKANADHTECVAAPIKISAGYYLPANSVQQQSCNNPKKFCPGGEFWKSSVDQGQYDCPFTGTSASSNYQRCTVTLSSEQLKFGVLGNNGSQCWSKTDPEDFQYCVLGLRGIRTEQPKTVNPGTSATSKSTQNISASVR